MESFKQNVIKHRTGLLNLTAELGNISKACKIMGFSRDTFYRNQSARDEGDMEVLFEVSRRKPNLKNRIEEATELAVPAFAIDFPAHAQVRASNELRKLAVFVSPSGVRSIWLRSGVRLFFTISSSGDAVMQRQAGLRTEVLLNLAEKCGHTKASHRCSNGPHLHCRSYRRS